MWHTGSILKSGVHGHREAKHQAAKRRRGFSHPARFEVLEQRLPLSVSGEPVPVSSVVADANGANPANPAVPNLMGTNATGSNEPGGRADPTTLTNDAPNDALAFNNPSWVPEDRPPIPFTSQVDNGLPANVNQVAGTPSGLRNFIIGANTSMAHGGSPRIGQMSTVRRPANVDTRMMELEQPLDERLMAAIPRPKAVAVVSPTTESSGIDEGALASVGERLPDSPVAPTAGLVEEEAPPHHALESDARQSGTIVKTGLVSSLNRSAIDGMMAEQGQQEVVAADIAVVEVASEQSIANADSAGGDLPALAASFAVAVAVLPERRREPNAGLAPRRATYKNAVAASGAATALMLTQGVTAKSSERPTESD